MAHGFEEAFAEHERRAHLAVQWDTWGHLAPKPRTSYRGWILFAISAWQSEPMLIDASFPELGDSPWLYDDLHRFIERDRHDKRLGGVYHWQGSYQKCKSGRPFFVGRIRRVKILPEGKP